MYHWLRLFTVVALTLGVAQSGHAAEKTFLDYCNAGKAGNTLEVWHTVEMMMGEERDCDAAWLKLTGLTGLALNNNQITDITPLKGLTGLTVLGLNNNQITDITPLKGLTRLTRLDLSDNQITDITPLKGLTGLTGLGLSYNQIDPAKCPTSQDTATEVRKFCVEHRDP